MTRAFFVRINVAEKYLAVVVWTILSSGTTPRGQQYTSSNTLKNFDKMTTESFWRLNDCEHSLYTVSRSQFKITYYTYLLFY